ncbi:MAG: hypothetical protein R2932_07080 [Caldilineaceae bacterium]
MNTQIHTEILRQTSKRPPVVIAAGDSQVQSTVEPYQLALPDLADSPMRLRILRGAGSFAEIKWHEPTTTVGVQFWGDTNDGHARILVDGAEVWQGNTQGQSVTFEEYIEIDGLPNTTHTVRVEATGQPGSSGGSDVTVAAFGWGSLSSPANQTIFVPIVRNM